VLFVVVTILAIEVREALDVGHSGKGTFVQTSNQRTAIFHWLMCTDCRKLTAKRFAQPGAYMRSLQSGRVQGRA
jgi:hypothetical protein